MALGLTFAGSSRASLTSDHPVSYPEARSCPSADVNFAGIRFALFDLDRTLLRGDTASLWTQYRRERGLATWRDSVQVAFWMAQYTLGVVNATQVVEHVMRPYAGRLEADLAEETRAFVERKVLPNLTALARPTLELHENLGHTVAIATAATVYATRPVAEALGVEHIICTELEVESGRLSGKLVDPLSYREGKRVRTARWLEQQAGAFSEAVFYSDSITDLPLLKAVGLPIVVNPDYRLRRLARGRKWIEQRWR